MLKFAATLTFAITVQLPGLLYAQAHRQAARHPVQLYDVSVPSPHVKNVNRKFLSGVQSTIQIAKRNYVIWVPGSEGGPIRRESRVDGVPIVQMNVVSLPVDELTFRRIDGTEITFVDAFPAIRNSSFVLYFAEGVSIPKTLGKIYSDGVVIVQRKPQLRSDDDGEP